MKYLAIALIALALSACGKIGQVEAHWTGWSESCVKGVQYIQFTSGASVEYDQAGHVVACK